MKKLVVFTFLSILSIASLAQGVIKTEVQKVNGQWEVLRGGEPYYIKGAGGHVHMDVVIECGGNSIRTWGLEGAQEILDEAHSKGLTVMLGLWMSHERHGFDYSDEWAVKDQLKGFRKAVEQFKDHPALLLWGVGNEVDLFYSDINVWDATEQLAAMIHEVDPNHPTCCVTAGIDAAEVQLINERAPSIDILGVNTYGGINNLKHSIDLFGWEGPYIVSEWGPTGHWEVQTTAWGAAIEETSYEKSQAYHQRYSEGILADREQCIGSYVFLWGQKQETTPTWYGLFLEDGSMTPAIDVLHRHWKGTEPANRAPDLLSMTMDGKERYASLEYDRGSNAQFEVKYEDKDQDAVTMKVEIIPESTDIRAGGDKEARPESVFTSTYDAPSGAIDLDLPDDPGAYRVFVYLHDSKGKAATGNFPFYVR